MTACRNKARGAVVAALAGALTLGAAPVMALADGASLMDVSDLQNAFMRGTVASYTVGTTEYDGNDPVTVKKGKIADSEITITSVVPDGAGSEAVDVPAAGDTWYYEKADGRDADEDRTIVKVNGEWWKCIGNSWDAVESKGAGEYMAATTYDGSKGIGVNEEMGVEGFQTAPAVKFTIVADSLEGARVMKDLGDGEFTDELTYEYGVRWDDLVVVLDGVEINSGVDFEVYEKNEDNPSVKSSGILPGTYEVVITGDDYEGEEKYDLTVGKLDLSTLDLYLDDVTVGHSAPSIKDVKGADKLGGTNSGSYLDGKYLNFDIDKTWATNGTGEYTYTITVKDTEAAAEAAKRIEGTGTVKVSCVKPAAEDASWTYDGEALTNEQTIDVDASLEKDDVENWKLKSLDLSKLGGTYLDADNEEQDLQSGQFAYTLYNAKGEEVDGFAAKGKYKLVLETVPSELGFDVKTSRTVIYIDYKQGIIGTADTVFTFDGKVVTDLTDTNAVTYSGQDMMDRLGIQVKDTQGNVLEAGADYTVTIRDSQKRVVDQIVDVDTYTVSVTSDSFAITGADDNNADSIEIQVKPFAVNASTARVTFPTAITYTESYLEDYVVKTRDVTFVPYTGEDIVPVVEVALTEDEDGEPVWTTLDSTLYDLDYSFSAKEGAVANDKVDSVNKVGWYKFNLTIDAKETDNFTGSDEQFGSADGKSHGGKYAHVADTKVFVDVPNTEYYAQSVYTAVNEGYVEGMGGTDLFMPNKSMSRAEMVCVLYRMAGGTAQGEDWVASPNDKTYLSRFSDVKGDEFFAQALAWAAKAGVVTGYEDGTFGPADDVTVEQYVTMLARYAEVKGDYEAVDTDAVLAGVADGSQVSEFGQDAVAWAVESGYLAQGGADIQPQSPVTRGRAVTIAVRYQPAQADVIAR